MTSPLTGPSRVQTTDLPPCLSVQLDVFWFDWLGNCKMRVTDCPLSSSWGPRWSGAAAAWSTRSAGGRWAWAGTCAPWPPSPAPSGSWWRCCWGPSSSSSSPWSLIAAPNIFCDNNIWGQVLSLVYLRETQHQQHWADTTALVTHNKQDRYRGTGVQGYWGAGVHVDCCYRQLTTEERLLQWGAANNVKIKVSSVTVVSILTWSPGLRSPGPGPPPPGTRCGAPASCPPAGGPAAGSCSWSTPRWRGKYLCDHIKIFTLHLQADPCTSLYDLACGGWVKNVTSGRGSVGSLATVSVMDENKLEVDKKIRGEHLTFVICPPPLRCVQTSYWHCRTPGPRPPPLDRISGPRLRHSTGAARTRRPSSGWATPPPWSSCTTPSAGTWTPPCPTPGTSPRS